MAEDLNSPQNADPRLEQALRDLAAAEAVRPDDVTRRRHLVAMRKARSGRRSNFVGVSAAAAMIALVVSAAIVSNNGNGINGPRNMAATELLPLNEDPKLSPVPFERTEEYVILRVDAARAASVAKELAAVSGTEPAVVGRTKNATTYVVPKSVAQSLTATEGVSAVPDTKMKATAQQTNPPSWGLDRIDSAVRDNSYSYISEGAGRYVYVIDTGIYSGNSDFGGRVRSGYDAVNDGNGTTDCNGHGTHVAGTIAGNQYGVAKSATVVAVRVLDCTGSGYSSSVVAGINWVIASHPGGTGVINLSLGGAANAAVDQAVADATSAGLVVVVAAGNSSADACGFSPARAPSALTIGAIDESNAKAGYSNTGSCVDMWAPGTGITSDWIGSSSATQVLSGTSMASPHVAGLAARLLQARPAITVSEMETVLTSASRTADPAALPVVEFAEAPDFATPTTTIDPATTTTDAATTTVPDVTTTVPDVTTTIPDVTTTVPAVTTTVPVATTTVPAPTTTAPRRDDDDDDGDSKKPKKPKKPTARPREFELRYGGEDRNRSTLYAVWVDDNTPDAYRIECAKQSGGVNAPVDTTIAFTKLDAVNGEKGRHRYALPVIPTAGSRCWMVALVGTVASDRSNVAIIPPARKRDDDKRPPVTTTTTAVPVTTTTTAPATTTTAVPVTTTTVSPSTTVSGVKAGVQVVVPKAATTTVPRTPAKTTVPPKKKSKSDD